MRMLSPIRFEITMSEQLIELVRQRKVLFDTKCKHYKDQSVRNAAWEDIAGKLNDSVENCKEEWTKLRNAFASALKRRRTKKHGQAATVYGPWKYEDSMSFLLPFMESRNTKTNTSDEITNEDLCESPPGSPSSIRSNKSYRSQCTLSSKRTNKSQLKGLYEYVKSTQDFRRQRQNLMLDIDEIDLFFLSMSMTVKALPKLDQTKIKLDLHSAISQAEIRLMEDRQNILTSPVSAQRSLHLHNQPPSYIQLTTQDQSPSSTYIQSTQDQSTIYMHPHTSILQPTSTSQHDENISFNLKTYYNNPTLYCSENDC